MTVKLSFDAGHGKYTAGKRAPSGKFEEREWFFNDKILRYCLAYLKNYDVQTKRVDDPTGERDILLASRVNSINSFNPKAHFSFHNNAYLSKWGNHGGTEVFHSRSASQESKNLANLLQNPLVNALGTKNRGVKADNFYIITYTNCPSVLIEFLFMDSNDDIKKLRSNTYLKKAGETVAKQLVSYYGLKKKGSTSATSKPSNNSNKKPATSSNKKFKVGDKATVSKSATKYANGASIASFVKGSTYKVKQVKSDRVLLEGINSWVYNKDVTKTGSTSTSTTTKTTNSSNKKIKVGSKVKVKKSIGKFATGQPVANFVKGGTYTVKQVKSDRVLLDGINSWVYLKDLEGNPSTGASNNNTSRAKKLSVGSKVKIKSSAKYYANTGSKNVAIPSKYKNKNLTVQQIKGSNVLIKEIVSWVAKSDVTVV